MSKSAQIRGLGPSAELAPRVELIRAARVRFEIDRIEQGILLEISKLESNSNIYRVEPT